MPPTRRPSDKNLANMSVGELERIDRQEREQHRQGYKKCRARECERYTADPLAFIGEVLAREYKNFAGHPIDQRYRNRLWNRADDFILGYYLRALKKCYKQGDPGATRKFIDGVRNTILNRIPESTFRNDQR
jgi:hypothetical protein